MTMSNSTFHHVKIVGYNVVLPKNYIDIDDELQYFDNNPKKLARQKKMIGFGRRYIADALTSVTDLAQDAVQKLFTGLNIRPENVEALIFSFKSLSFSQDSYSSLNRL